jgi:hypothetical protein
MKKGCIVTLLIVGILVVICGGGVFFAVKNYGNPFLLAQIEETIKDYRALYPDRKVETSNKAWFEAITAESSNVRNKKEFLQIFPDHEFKDLYQTPVKLQQRPDGTIAAISAGPDRKIDTPDDETSEKFMKAASK